MRLERLPAFPGGWATFIASYAGGGKIGAVARLSTAGRLMGVLVMDTTFDAHDIVASEVHAAQRGTATSPAPEGGDVGAIGPRAILEHRRAGDESRCACLNAQPARFWGNSAIHLEHDVAAGGVDHRP